MSVERSNSLSELGSNSKFLIECIIYINVLTLKIYLFSYKVKSVCLNISLLQHGALKNIFFI